MSKLYPKLLKNVILPIADDVMHTNVYKFTKLLNALGKFSRDEIIIWQDEKLQQLIKHCYNNVPYYREVMDKLHLVPSDIKTQNDLSKLPFLTKNIIRDNFDKLKPSNIQKIRYKNHSTGGSTGEPLKYLFDLNSWSMSIANHIVKWHWTGYNYGEPYIGLGSSSLFPNKGKSIKHKIFYSLQNYITLNGINLSDSVLKKYTKLLEEKRIKYVYGYASAIYLWADYLIRTNKNIKINACITTSEILTDSYRQTIEKAFQCNVFDEYGARDGGIFTFQCEEGNYHIGENSILEVVDDNGDIIEEGKGEAAATDLFNYAMPFIRYKIGDIVDVSKDICNCGHQQKLIKKVYGRTSDIIRLKNGHTLTGPGFTILFKDLNVLNYSIAQSGPLSIDVILQVNDNYKMSEEKLIEDTIKKQAGDDCFINIKYVDKFELTMSGKRRYFVSNVEQTTNY